MSASGVTLTANSNSPESTVHRCNWPCFAKPRRRKDTGLGRMTMPETLMQSTAMAVYALMLAARAENLGVGMVSILEPEDMARLFDVPESWRFAFYLCIGVPEFTDDTPLLHRAGWQANTPTTWDRR